jgi:hypothetical protein
MSTATASALSASRLTGGAAHVLQPPPLTGAAVETAASGELERMSEEIATLRRRLQELEGQ